MNDLIKISPQRTVDARELHTFLQVGTKFADWIRDRIEKFGFEEQLDFFPFFGRSEAGRELKEYALSIGMAKELSMVENNDQGRKARRYLIAAEEELQALKRLTPAQQLLASVQLTVELEKRMLRTEANVKMIAEAAHVDIVSAVNDLQTQLTNKQDKLLTLDELNAVSGPDWTTVRRYTDMFHEGRLSQPQTAIISRRCKAVCASHAAGRGHIMANLSCMVSGKAASGAEGNWAYREHIVQLCVDAYIAGMNKSEAEL